MVIYLRIALRFYKWLAILFAIIYIAYIIYDDYVFIEMIESLSDLGMFLLFQSLYLAMYFSAFSLYYWIVAFVVAGVSHIAKKNKVKSKT